MALCVRNHQVENKWVDECNTGGVVIQEKLYGVCCLMFPYLHIKLPKIQKIIDHYDGKVFDGKVVDLE